MSLSPVHACLCQWAHHPCSCAKWIQTHFCHLHSWADQTEVSNQIGSCHRARDAWLGMYGYIAAFSKKHCITIVYFVSSDIKTILFIYFCLLKSLVVGLSLPSWHNLSTFISVPVSSWRCWAFRAATPGGSRALPPNRPSGQSPVKGTSLLVSPPLLWRPCLTPHHVTRCKKTISLMSS